MKKQVQSFNIGKSKRLVLEVDADDEQETQFLNDCKQVAETNPLTIQDFFIGLERVQKTDSARIISSNEGGKQQSR